MILVIIFFIFILYHIYKYYNKETFLDRDNSSLLGCNHFTEKINILFSIFRQRRNAYSHPKHRIHGIMRPMLFYFWDNRNIASKNFKENIFNPNSFDDCDVVIQNQLKYLSNESEGFTPYSKVRDNLSNIKLSLDRNNQSLFKCDNLYPDDMHLENNQFYLFKQNYTDFLGNYDDPNDPNGFKFQSNGLEQESSTEYNSNEKNSNNLRILDIDLGCGHDNGNKKNFCGFLSGNGINTRNSDRQGCCFNDISQNNNGIINHWYTNETVDEDACCKSTTALAFIPEASLIMKIIRWSKNEFLENRDYYGYEDYNISNRILSSYINNKDDFNTKNIISHCPEFVMWDGFGIYVKKESDNIYYAYIINEYDDVEDTLGGVIGQDLKLTIDVDNTGDLSAISQRSQVFRNFIRNHFYIYRKNGLNFFEYMCLYFKIQAEENGNSYLADVGTSPTKYFVKDNKLTEHGVYIAQELYKYYVKSDINYDSLLGNQPLYDDLHIDYYTLTKFYGNNNCQYLRFKLLYEMKNINFSWEVCDIMRFVINTLYLPYKIMSGRGCLSKSIDNSSDVCWADELLDSYNNPTYLNCGN